MRIADAGLVLASLVVLLVLPLPSALANELRFETWGENAVGGSASEGTHAWVTHGLYDRGRELGMGRAAAAGCALGIMVVWEVVEVGELDARGVSVQDLAANTAGVLAGVAGAQVNYSYAALSNPPHTDDKFWMSAPLIPRNDMTSAVEIGFRCVTLGYKYLGKPGDVVVGSTSMPVLPGERGEEKLVGYVGRLWPSGWHCAVGYDGLGDLMLGGGYRVRARGMGLDLTAVAGEDGVGLGVSYFVEYGSIF
jgi:hypothetical protein